jgi:RNA polymerase sigma-70 factor (ECF subfamily)
MEPLATSALSAVSVENPAREIDDFESVVRLYWPRVFRFALASLRDRDAAQTLAQDCFLRAYRGRERFRGESSISTWLMQIAVNLARDHARSRRMQFWKRIQPMGQEQGRRACREIDPEAQALVNEQVRAVWDATAELSERQRTVFLLRFVEEMELLEIASVTGLTENAVKVHLFRAVRAVRKRMGRRA